MTDTPQHREENFNRGKPFWQPLGKRKHSAKGRPRSQPGANGSGKYYRILLSPKEVFTAFRYQDVGDPGHLVRLAGRLPDGSWETHAWLISKQDAHIEKRYLVPDTQDARELMLVFGSTPIRIKGDIFVVDNQLNDPKPKELDSPATEGHPSTLSASGGKG